MFWPEGTLTLNLKPLLYLGNSDNFSYLVLVIYYIDTWGFLGITIYFFA